MKYNHISRLGAILLALIVGFSMTMAGPAFASEKQKEKTEPKGDDQITLAPGSDGAYVSKLIDRLGGKDDLYKDGLNGFDMYEDLGYVFMGWRTTGGIWQNQVIGGHIMDKLKAAGYKTTDASVEAPYGTKSASDKSDAATGDYAWEIQYQQTNDKKLGNTWDPEYASLDVQLVKTDGTAANDAEADALAKKIGGQFWSFNPATETYQKNFAKTFGMDYEEDIASLPDTSAKVDAMHKVLMTSDVDKESRTSVDDYKYIKRDSIGGPNLEALLNQRTKLARDSCFTDPAGTDPAKAKGSAGEFVYVGKVDPYGSNPMKNSEKIPPADLKGKILLTDSSEWEGFVYAQEVKAIGVASKEAVDSFLCPKDGKGKISEPWYDSARYAGGEYLNQTIEQTESGAPIVEWQFSNQQYDSLKALLAKAGEINGKATKEEDKVKVTARQIAIGQTYPMTKTSGKPGVGQAVAIAEVKGSVHPDRRIMICAHVQEPGSNDNATGVASLLGMATKYKQMIDAGKIERPKCTITFMWGDEMNMATYWMDGHKEETKKLIGALDMDMTGEDPEKTGGVMRIEKTPDPSADYGYTLDAVPWNEPDDSIPSLSHPYYDKTYQNKDGDFVRLPDSHTLWGAGGTDGLFKSGWYLNDLYMYVTSTVIKRHDPHFNVRVCPYEGGSDHSEFLNKNIPALLTWHFTDYTYHTSSDTLYMSSPRELESVGLTTLVTGLMMSDLCDDNQAASEVLAAVREAGLKRMDAEAINTKHHQVYANAGHTSMTKALKNEKKVLAAWGKWYEEALDSVATLVDEPSADLKASIEAAKSDMNAKVTGSLKKAGKVLDPKKSAESKKVTGLKGSSKKSRITLKWDKTPGVSGYQVSYKLKSSKRYKTLTVTEKHIAKTKKLKKGKKYQFKVRAYTTLKGKKVYGPYCKAKTVKCK